MIGVRERDSPDGTQTMVDDHVSTAFPLPLKDKQASWPKPERASQKGTTARQECLSWLKADQQAISAFCTHDETRQTWGPITASRSHRWRRGKMGDPSVTQTLISAFIQTDLPATAGTSTLPQAADAPVPAACSPKNDLHSREISQQEGKAPRALVRILRGSQGES